MCDRVLFVERSGEHMYCLLYTSYLDVSVQAVPLIYLWIQHMIHGRYPMWIAPFGNPRLNAYLRLHVAYRSLLRPSSATGAKAFTLRSF